MEQLTYTLNNGTKVLGTLHNGKTQPVTFVNNAQAQIKQVLIEATGCICSVYIPPMSRTRYIKIG